ncbi:MAG: hypothetical protein AAF587_06320 [Bacteroidota bacterium]
MESFVDFVSRLIYATDGEAVITPNHQSWLDTHPDPSGLEWLEHYLDRLLPAYENWLSTNHLPPIIPWTGEDTQPWEAGQENPLTGAPLANPSSISSLERLGTEFLWRYDDMTIELTGARELRSLTKAPFSYRFWGYLKFADLIRKQYQGEIVVPPAIMFDRDGTILSPIPFTNVFNSLHGNWHGGNNPSGPNSQPTPGYESSAGQSTSSGGIGMGAGEEFIKFHHDHTDLFSRWLARTNQLPVKPINLYNGGSGWPASGAGNPSSWVEAAHDLWINSSNGDTDNQLLDILGNVDAIGSAMNFSTPMQDREGDPIDPPLDSTTIHGSGHTRNSDISSLAHNNFVPRFHAWHGWIDSQWYWRKPRFGYFDDVSKQRVRVFEPVLTGTGDSWPGMKAVTIIRDSTLSEDTLAPDNGLVSHDFVTGSGTLRMRFQVQDPYNRRLQMRFLAEVFDDSSSAVTEVIPEASHTYHVGSIASGDDFDRDTAFTIDFAFANAFQSDDPSRSNPAVGFVNNRIRITGTLEVADGSDPGFIETAFLDIDLIQEKSPPEIDLYFDLSTFGEDQVAAALSESTSTEAEFTNAIYVTVQDRTSDANPIDWAAHPDVATEVRGLIEGFAPASGLFEDEVHAPDLVLWDLATDAPLVGVRIERHMGPTLEDASLPDNLPQRFTYGYSVIFEEEHEAFEGLALGESRSVEVRATVADRSGNQGSTTGSLTMLRAANPFMRDGSTSWLSIDTRVFHILEGDERFGEMMSTSRNPNEFIQTILTKLNAGDADLGDDTFDTLPTNQSSSALLPFETITDQTTSSTRVVHNFALAKVRLQGAGGADTVRAFFRLFRYSATNLVFDPNSHYRTHTAGGDTKIALLGYEGEFAGAELVSIPFFAEERQSMGDSMTLQTDTPNVQSFPTGISSEQVLYFGVYLDINQASVRFPMEYLAAHPDGGFLASDPTQSLPTLMLDHHQCMVVEINFDPDPTEVGAKPSNSDNLAQRNLMILSTDNPGSLLTHTVQHSFEVDLGGRKPRNIDLEREQERHLVPSIPRKLFLVSSGKWQQSVREFAINLAMNSQSSTMMEWRKFVPMAERQLQKGQPLIFDKSQWTNPKGRIDELMILWGDLPSESKATLYFPRINCEQIINLRNLRHGPSDVQIVDSHTISCQTSGVTFLPLPPNQGTKIAGLITVELPDGIKKGQGWTVDVIQLRGGEQIVTGGFQMDIQVKIAEQIVANEIRFLSHSFDQLSLLPTTNRWHPVMKKRVEMMRGRAAALAESAGIDWADPTVYEHPDEAGNFLPFEGPKVRVVLEHIQVLDDLDTFFKGKGELHFETKVYSTNNGGQLQQYRFPPKGEYKISDKAGENMISIDAVIFEGYVTDDLQIELIGHESDLFDPDDTLGKYSRIHCGEITQLYGQYGPNQEVVDPEDLGSWRVWYRIERA